MKLFGLEITKSKDSKAGKALVPHWAAGIAHLDTSNFEAMIKAYKSWIYVCGNKNALTIAQQNLKLYVAKPTSSTKLLQPTKSIDSDRVKYLNSLHTVQSLKQVKVSVEVEEVLSHPFLDIFQYANQFTSSFDLLELTTLYQELTGNAYWYIIYDPVLKIPTEIWLIPPQGMKVVPCKENMVAGYIYSNGTTEVPFDPEEIIHFKYANPKSLFYGMSPLMAVADAYNTNENIARFTNALFTNMARPEGVLYTEKNLNEDDFKILKKQWNEAYGGASKAKKTAVLTKGLQYKPITMTPQELDYSEGRKIVKEEICNAFGQSLAMYSEKSNRANSEQAYLGFLRDTIQPRLRRIENTLNRSLLAMYDSALFVAFDSPIPEDKTYRLKERESNIKLGYSSINQERVADGKDEVEWGSVPILPQNMMPLGSAPPSPADPAPSSSSDEGGDGAKFIVRQLIDKFRSGDIGSY